MADDLLELLAEMEREANPPAEPEPAPEPGDLPLPLCRCLIGRSTGHDGWSLERNPDSIYYGMWVHAHPACRRPRHPHLNGTQKL